MKKVKLTATLVHQNDEQNFYKLNHKLLVGKSLGKNVDIITEMNFTRKNWIKENFAKYMSKDGCDIICISDASTHSERLVFVGVEYIYNGKKKYGRTNTVIHGKRTFLSKGGDITTMKEHKVYIRMLATLNNMEFDKIN